VGNVWYHYSCQAIIARVRETDCCYDALPIQLPKVTIIQYRNDRAIGHPISDTEGLGDTEPILEFFAEPVTFHIVLVAPEMPCLAIFPHAYPTVNGSHWLKVTTPRLVVISVPKVLMVRPTDLFLMTTTDNFDTEEGGIYTPEAIRDMVHFNQALRVTQAVATSLARQLEEQWALHHGGRPLQWQGHNQFRASDLFSDLSVVLPSAFSFFAGLWKFIEGYGMVCSVIMASMLLNQWLNSITNFILRQLAGPINGSWLTTIIVAFLPSLRDFLLSPFRLRGQETGCHNLDGLPDAPPE